MTYKYQFTSIKAMAEFAKVQAMECREDAKKYDIKSDIYVGLINQASAYEIMAKVIENAEIVGPSLERLLERETKATD